MKIPHALPIVIAVIFMMCNTLRATDIDYNNYRTINRDSLLRLANDGNLDAMCDLGKIYSLERTISSARRAFEVWKESAEKGHKESCFRVGLCYHFGEGVKNDAVEALNWFMKSPYDCSEYVKLDLPYIKRRADSRDSEAMCTLGKMYIFGYGVDKDVSLGLEYLEQSKTIKSYELLSTIYQRDDLVAKDWDKAIEYYKKGADLGDYKALSYIAYCQWNGYIIAQNLDDALSNFEECYSHNVWEESERASGTIPYIIGTLYLNPAVGRHNIVKGMQYLKEAAEKYNDSGAMVALALIYYNGLHGIKHNYDEAFYWLERASNCVGFSAKVYEMLSKCYRFGRGVELDETKAQYYANRALKLNDVQQDKLRILEMDLPAPKLVNIEMVPVSGGTLKIGATAAQKSQAYDREYPSIQIFVNSFAIGKYEVTQKQWYDVMGYNNSEEIGDDLPVHNISWQEIQLFIDRLNNVSGKKYRLPTEAEWEYAARGGQLSREYYYIGGNDLEEIAWLDRSLHPVGTKVANELGIYDMAGNVWEYCADYLGGYGQYFGNNAIDPKGKDDTVVARRGGSSFYFEWGCRPSFRGTANKGHQMIDTGFRLCLEN